jgi:DNA-binding response OmpR family regulator
MSLVPLSGEPLAARTRALIVDHDPDTRRMYADYLTRSAWIVEEAADGREALAKALSQSPDIIITETRLPGMSGFDLCNLLRTDAATRGTPIVFVTASALDADLLKAQRVGADSILIKPCLPATLLAEIRQLLEVSAALRERSRVARDNMRDQVARSDRLMDRSRESPRRTMLRKEHARHDTTTPATQPPALVCPDCNRLLKYLRSHIGGVNARQPEQWDYFECATGCGTFQFRERTRKLRKV